MCFRKCRLEVAFKLITEVKICLLSHARGRRRFITLSVAEDSLDQMCDVATPQGNRVGLGMANDMMRQVILCRLMSVIASTTRIVRYNLRLRIELDHCPPNGFPFLNHEDTNN